MSTGCSKDFDGKAFRIGWDAGNGAAGPILEKLVARLPGEHHHALHRGRRQLSQPPPRPDRRANLADLKRLVANKSLDFGVAFDGDGDRIGAIDGEGRVIWGDQLLMILAEPVLEGRARRDHHRRRQGQPDAVRPHRRAGRQAADVEDRHSLIKSKMKETGAPLAGEMSGHIFFKHRWYGFDDALYAAVRLIAATARAGKSLTEMRRRCRWVATPELRFQVDESAQVRGRRRGLDRLADGAEVNATDGVRVTTPDGWWLLRASNTQDVLVARAEAKDRAVERLVAQIDEQLAKSGVRRSSGALDPASGQKAPRRTSCPPI